MRIARQMLAESGEPIICVAQRVGYGCEASFSRVFRKHHAFAPAGYRRQAQKTT